MLKCSGQDIFLVLVFRAVHSRVSVLSFITLLVRLAFPVDRNTCPPLTMCVNHEPCVVLSYILSMRCNVVVVCGGSVHLHHLGLYIKWCVRGWPATTTSGLPQFTFTGLPLVTIYGPTRKGGWTAGWAVRWVGGWLAQQSNLGSPIQWWLANHTTKKAMGVKYEEYNKSKSMLHLDT